VPFLILNFCNTCPCALYYEHIATINDVSRVDSKQRSKLWHLSHDSRGVIYDQNVFKIYAPRVVNYAPKTFTLQMSLMMIVIYNCHVFIVQATDLSNHLKPGHHFILFWLLCIFIANTI
jgi:hypothetical protein